MTMPPDYSDNKPSKMSTGKKTLIGCGIGCVTIIALVLIAVGFGGWWLFSKEDQSPTDRILNTDSSAAFRLEDISQNQEVIQLITDVSRELERTNHNRSPVQFPGSFGKYNNYFEGRQDPSGFIKFFAPKEATLSMSSDGAGNTVYTVAANFGKGTRIPKLFLNSIFESNEELKDKKISTDHGDLYLFDRNFNRNGDKFPQFFIGFYKGTFIFSNDKGSALSALDQLADENNSGKLNETLSTTFSRLGGEGSMAYGVLDSSQAKMLNHDIDLFQGELASEMKKAEISIDQVSSEKGSFNVNIDWSNKDFALKANEEIEKLKAEWIKKAEQNGFDMDITNSLNDENLDIQFRVNDLKNSLVYMIKNMD